VIRIAEPISVLIVHSSADAYGSDRVCLDLAISAQGAGCAVTVAVPQEGTLVESLRESQIAVVCLDALILRRADLRSARVLKTAMKLPSRIARLRRFARSYQFDVIHANCAVTLGCVYLRRRWRAPLVWHVHEYLPSGFGRRLFVAALSRATVILTCSESVRRDLPTSLSRRARVAYSGARESALVEGKPPFSTGTIEIVCVGRLNGWKGQRNVVTAVGLLRRQGIDATARIAGDVYPGEDRYRIRLLKQIESLGLKGIVDLVGFRTDVAALMATADVVVVPSERPEPFGLVVVEAMAQARPVVVSRGGGPDEVITDGVNGVLVDATAEDIAEAIKRLARDPLDAARMGERARIRSSEFAPENAGQVALSAYSDALAQAESGAGTSRRLASAVDT
jgi:glycosyltransferase involved in cell wall biosynthesis